MESRRVMSWLLVGLPAGLLLAIAVVAMTVMMQGDSGGETPVDRRKAAGVVPGGEGVEAKLRDYVVTLSERVGERSATRPEGLRAAELFLESTFGERNIGYQVRRREFTAGGKAFANLEMVLAGRDRAEEVVVVGAHYDTAPGSPGADDNASGVAALLVLAEQFAGRSQSRSIRWVAFCNEEPPWFQTEGMGSVRYAAELRRESVNVAAMIALESLGYFSDEPGSQKYPEPLASLYPDKGNFLGVVGNPASRGLVDFVHSRIQETGLIPVEKGVFPESVPGVGWSDHWGFWREGYPAVMLTDTAPYRNPHYHRATDRADTVDYRRLAGVVNACAVLVKSLANAPGGSW